MYAASELLRENAVRAVPRRRRTRAVQPARIPPLLAPWLRSQAINVTRHAAALRPFRQGEFGTDASAPTEGHMQAVNELIKCLRGELLKRSERVTGAAQ